MTWSTYMRVGHSIPQTRYIFPLPTTFHEQNGSLFLYVLFSRETLDLMQCGEQLDYRNTSS